jgi:hypothetical protein
MRMSKCLIKLRAHFLLHLAICLLYIKAAQNLPRQSSEAPKVILPFSIQQPEASGNAPGTVIEQHDGARGEKDCVESVLHNSCVLMVHLTIPDVPVPKQDGLGFYHNGYF